MSKVINVKNLEIGQGNAKICIPIVGNNREEVLEQTEQVMALNPDIVEFRADCCEKTDVEAVLELLKEIKDKVNDTPIIFTFRTTDEGGNKEISLDDYYKLNLEVVKSGLVDLIDVEAYSKKETAKTLIDEIHKIGGKVIASNHNFEFTPEGSEITEILTTMEQCGGDIVKIAVMPNSKTDVDTLIEASAEADKNISVPVVTMSMGSLGAVTRVCTALTGSAITFAAGPKSSAPGQIDISMVRDIIKKTKDFSFDKNIMLVGFMGTGKTTVSWALKKMTSMEEVDMDSYIVEREGMSIPDIFEQYGEEGFRQRETEALSEIQEKSGRIVSCGGGIVLKDENITMMKKDGVVMLLTATPEVIFDRVKNNSDRPLLNNNMNLSHIKGMMDARKERYEMAADYHIDTNHSDLIRTCYDIINNCK